MDKVLIHTSGLDLRDWNNAQMISTSRGVRLGVLRVVSDMLMGCRFLEWLCFG